VPEPEPDVIAELEASAAPRRRTERAPEPVVEDIPICALEDQRPPWDEPEHAGLALVPAAHREESAARRPSYRLPPTSLLNEPQPRSDYDEQELKEVAVRIKSKFEEFNVLGSVVQINPGPVVTTFEFKPEAGIKYSRMVSLMEDLCLGLQAESILIERIPGKPTVGIEVPNRKREIIALRQVLESDEFTGSASKLTISMGKDISGRIKVAPLETMPHVLIAGSTGSGKSVMINSLVMSILYKSTPDEVRMIMVDPKRVELGVYEGVPHLLTPVITDPKKATYALRNAVLEMERRLRLLAEQGVRNIDQYNKKVLKLQHEPRSLFEEDEEGVPPAEELKPLPYILILIDELADLMILEGRNVEESVTRLAQMARAVGMHLVLATQRPSVDVITGLIKANFPARMSFRVATRVDSRTILDIMGAEHLLGKGDMLFLPPGSSRLRRVHGAFVTESEINSVVEFWKEQAAPEYDQSFLVAPPAEGEGAEGDAEPAGEQDPMYEEALRIVLEVGKASTSTLQRRLRLGYGRAARILDMMHRDGIIGPPDGSKPREVLKRTDWLREPVS
jgi:S-DNA-T family DNA segregation ATPase FtsK/SpoIIIE